MEESNLCECEVPIKVVGDIHAQFQDMNRLFDLIGRVPQEKFLFLGDYVDRGPQGVEVVILLFALKLRYRDRIFLLRGNHETPAVNKIYGFYNECVMKYGAGIWIFLLRGNHETPAVNKIYGFYNECVMKYGAGIWWDFQACFNRIPLAGLISKRVCILDFIILQMM
ncbi:unnamed protein product [Strongylus vulgaris]|uniref:Serine/threonine-protein phosphatase n=1 Tax=Strongylus vulgaris TaxID=40348 RepID=A0A3P7J8K9_STRVU|nr:unnamed protein product [Strongylus vulgaris]